MKKLILLLAAMIAVSAYAQKPAEAPERKNWDSKQPLYGNVQSLKVVSSEYDFDYGVFNVSRVENYKFNAKGDVTEMSEPNSNDMGVVARKFKYDANRNMVEMDGCLADGEIYAKYTYKYNSQGKLVEELYYHGSDLVNYASKRVHLLNSEGLSLGAVYYDSDGTVTSKYDFVYDNDGNRVEEHYENSIYVFEYDDNGNMIEQYEFEDGALVTEAKFIYDDQNRLIEETWMNGNGIFEHATKRYNSQGLPVEASIYGEGNAWLGTSTIKYDSDGRVIERIDKMLNQNDVCQTFKYDSNGNLVEHVIDYQEYLEVMLYTYDSHNNLVLKEIFEVYGENTFPTSKISYEIVYRQ